MNGIITLNHEVHDQVNWKHVIDNKIQGTKISGKKIMKKNLLLKMQKSFLRKGNGILMLLNVGFVH